MDTNRLATFIFIYDYYIKRCHGEWLEMSQLSHRENHFMMNKDDMIWELGGFDPLNLSSSMFHSQFGFVLEMKEKSAHCSNEYKYYRDIESYHFQGLMAHSSWYSYYYSTFNVHHIIKTEPIRVRTSTWLHG